jgi:hypothetical protein
VHRSVDPAPALLELLAQPREVLGPVDVELEHVRRLREALRRALGHRAHAAEARQQHLGAGVLGLLGDREGDAASVDDPRDEDPLAVEDHKNTSTVSALP